MQRFGKRRHGDTYANQFVIGIGDKSHHSQVEYREVHLYILVDLSLRQRRVAVERAVRFVHQFEYFLSVVFGYFFPGGIFLYLEVVFSLNQFGDTLVLVGNGVRDIDFVFHPVGVFLEAEFLHVYGIVGVVVDSGHGAELVETFNQHTFRIEIGESERSGNVSHAPFLSPVFYCFDESGGYFRVVNEVYPPETDVLATPFLVGTVVDNSGYTSYDLVILVCQKIICFTEFECCILTLVKCIEHIVVKVGDGVRIALVHSVIETDKFLKFSLCRDFLDCNSHISYL